LIYWLLTSEYPPFFGGGIGTYCAITARMMAAKGHSVSVFINDATVSNITVSEESSIRVIRFNTSRTNSSAFLGHVTNISYEFADIVKHFVEKEGKPDCIEAQEYLGITYYLLQYKLLRYEWCKDIPILVTMHSPSFLYMEYNQVPMYRYPNFWICEMERFCLQAADQIISPSQFMIRELDKRFRLSNKNIAIIPNPFEGEAYSSYKGISSGPEDQIVFYGKLTAQKGAFRLMAYFKKLWDEGFDRPLYLLGGQDIIYHPEGRSMGDIIRQQYNKYLEKGLLKMEPRVKPSDIAQRLSSAEVVIIPSDNDNLPYVAFEMMALGRIVLVSKQGGHSEVVENGLDGFIFDHNEPQTFSDQLKHILQLSPEERKKIAAAAVRKVTGNYNPDIIYSKKIQFLENLQKTHARSRTLFPFVQTKAVSPPVTPVPSRKGLLSIVVPYYNMGAYIDETIDSLLRTDYREREIIIVNDGSNEAFSIQKLNNYRKKNDITVIDLPNGGVANARNIGAQSANGEFLAFLDADDTVQPQYYSRAISVFNQYSNVHFAGCWVRYLGNSTKTWPAFQPEPPVILYHNQVNSSSLVYKREAFLSGGKNDTTMPFQGLEDYDSVISMLSLGFGGVVIPEPLFNYRVRPDSMIRAISVSKKLSLYQHISDKHKQFYATFAADVSNLLNANGPGISQDNPSLDHHLADRLPFGGKMAGKMIGLIKRNRYMKNIAYKVYKLLKK
jgi:glycosyltransferase involved in cell wall biosynthesis